MTEEERKNRVIKEEIFVLKHSISRIGSCCLKRDSDLIPSDRDILEAVRILESGIDKLDTCLCYRQSREEILRPVLNRK